MYLNLIFCVCCCGCTVKHVKHCTFQTCNSRATYRGIDQNEQLPIVTNQLLPSICSVKLWKWKMRWLVAVSSCCWLPALVLTNCLCVCKVACRFVNSYIMDSCLSCNCQVLKTLILFCSVSQHGCLQVYARAMEEEAVGCDAFSPACPLLAVSPAFFPPSCTTSHSSRQSS